MSLVDIPQEVWDEIDQYIDDGDLPALCMTCRHLLSLLESRAYRDSLTMTESASSSRRVLALSNGPRAHTLRHLTYQPTDPKPIRETEHDGYRPGAVHDPSVKLSGTTAEVLRSLARFPHLESVSVELLDWVDDWPGLPMCFVWDFDKYYRSEEEEPWRALLAGSFRALAESRGAFPNLRIHNLPPGPQYPVFETEAWQAFLGGLRSFEILLHGQEDGGAGNMTPFQEDFVENMARWFLAPATGLEHLSLLGDDEAYIGHFDTQEPIPWPRLTLPHLKTLQLRCTYANDVLGDFIARHAATIQTVRMEKCMAIWYPEWEALLGAVAAVDTPHLVEFTVIGYNDWEQGDESGEPGADEPDAVDRRLTTGETCESYGEIQLEFDRRYDLEDDEIAEIQQQKVPVVQHWNALQARVARNRSLAGLPPIWDTSLDFTP